MICLGLNAEEKRNRIAEYRAQHNITKTYVLSPKKFSFNPGCENSETIEWADIIMYRYFYRLVQEIDAHSLVVINECLRTQNRYDLTYNCIRHFLNQTRHQLIFQHLPFINDREDFMILFDFDTRSQWKRFPFDQDLLSHCGVEATPGAINFTRIGVKTDEILRAKYQKEKKYLIENIGARDPHTIPRNLYLLPGKAKMRHVDGDTYYIGRNNRFSIETMQRYKSDSYPHTPYTVFEFPHNFIDFADFAALSRQSSFNVLVSDLKVDQWYLNRYQEWSKRINEGYASLSER